MFTAATVVHVASVLFMEETLWLPRVGERGLIGWNIALYLKDEGSRTRDHAIALENTYHGLIANERNFSKPSTRKQIGILLA
jgi:hypothetical protein